MRTAHRRIVDTLTCYQEIAEDYDQLEEFKIVAQAEEKALLSSIGDVKTQGILDVGCGTGRYTKALEDVGAHMVRIDICEKMIHIAKTQPRLAPTLLLMLYISPSRTTYFTLFSQR